MPRATLLRLRRGLRAAVGAVVDAVNGELLLTHDTNELFVGEDGGTADPIKVHWDNLLAPPAEFPPEAHSHPNLRGDVVGVTANLADGASENLDLAVGKSAATLKITTTSAAWVRLYTTAAYRAADAGRPITTDPEGETGLIGEVLTTGANLAIDLAPAFVGGNGDDPAASIWYLSVTNKSGGAAAITVTLSRVVMEA